jgi:hypothetical protein
MNALSIPQRELGLLGGSLPSLRKNFEEVAQRCLAQETP